MNVVNFRPYFGESTPEHPAILQDESELHGLIELLKRENVQSYLEVGARYGGTFEAIMMALPSCSNGTAIDFPGGRFGDSNSASSLIVTVDRLRRRGYDVGCIFGPSGAQEVYDRAKAHGPYDAVFIDADHSYNAVSNDFESYSWLSNSIVILHDIAAPEGHASRAGDVVEVPRFWNEVKNKYRHEEIVAKNSLMGIGVLFLDHPTQNER